MSFEGLDNPGFSANGDTCEAPKQANANGSSDLAEVNLYDYPTKKGIHCM